jgi:hypothetical protein
MVGMAVDTTVDSIDARNRLSMIPSVIRIIRGRVNGFSLKAAIVAPILETITPGFAGGYRFQRCAVISCPSGWG